MPPLLLKLVFSRMKAARMPFFVKPVANSVADKVLATVVEPRVRDNMDFWEAEVAKAGWFVGDEMTAADIMMSFPVEAAAARAGLGRYPALENWLGRIHARDAYQAALDRGGEYSLLN